MKLIIAEKPSVAEAIAEAILGTKNKYNGYIEKDDYIVTWVFGHMLQLKEPEDYDIKYKKWTLADLPIYFEDWGFKPKEIKARKTESPEETLKREGFQKVLTGQLRTIYQLVKKCDVIIHAGDPDDEGQLLIDEILEFFKNTKPVKRVLINDNNSEAIKKSFKNLKDNKEYEPLGKSAYARAVSDYLVGINASRYFSLINRTMGLTVGRVQTPTLGLIVNRDLQIESHEKQKFYEIFTDINVNKNLKNKKQGEKIFKLYKKEFPSEEKNIELKNLFIKEFEALNDIFSINLKYIPSKELFENGKIESQIEAEEISKNFKGDTKLIITKTIEKENPPLPFNLLKLQVYANTKWGYPAEQTLKISQNLREKYKAITYNRSDSQYLNDEHFTDAPDVIKKAMKNINIYPEGVSFGPIKPKCFDSSKVTAHHAIIPTNRDVNLNRMTIEEKNIYEIITKMYIAQFLPKLIKEKTTAEIDFLESEKLRVTSSKILDIGYYNFLNDKNSENSQTENDTLSKLYPGEYQVTFLDSMIKEKETTPPKRYTEATLLQDMASISKYVKDLTIKKLLKDKDKDKKGENGGIGTPATRAEIIKGLFFKKFVELKGKNIISTPLGREFYLMLPTELKSADITAKWWVIQEEIKEKSAEPFKLILNTLETLKEVMTKRYDKISLNSQGEVIRKELIGVCPKCGGSILIGQDKKGDENYYCENYRDCSFRLWKNMKHFNNPLEITKEKAISLLKNEKVEFSLLNKNGDKYQAYLKLKINGIYVNFELNGYPEKSN
ncbi:DNA topoisomerase [uncultured Cetobacterium sp.]|uniref:DNA topoisomerase n=3 Tax=uncultured Cetobacterium sp. TaxID=527638 RepID=UPI0026214B6B|nr:DNA topoisomerase [uncultured Cetobacterium sp.]